MKLIPLWNIVIILFRNFACWNIHSAKFYDYFFLLGKLFISFRLSPFFRMVMENLYLVEDELSHRSALSLRWRIFRDQHETLVNWTKSEQFIYLLHEMLTSYVVNMVSASFVFPCVHLHALQYCSILFIPKNVSLIRLIFGHVYVP